ncbi:MAG: hypothetical protein ACOYVD_15110 [Bacillota bacterium]
MEYTIEVEYLGTIRLLIKKKFDIYTFTTSPTLGLLVQEIGRRYGEGLMKECAKLVFVNYAQGSGIGRFYRLPKDDNVLLEENSIVKILNVITGG